MQNRLSVTVLDSKDDLFEDGLSNIFFQLPPFAHIGKKIATRGELNHDENVLLRLEELI